MKKPHKLKKGDKVAIVSLSRGLLGMPFCKHELDLGLERLKEFGLEPVLMPNALKDLDYLEAHPEARAEDLKQAFMDDSIQGIICAIGGNDTFRILPYLMEDEEFIQAVEDHPKLFTGFSDTTIDHLALYRLGLRTFYGPCFLVDLAELDQEMLPYTKHYFEKYFLEEPKFEISSSDVWYRDRVSYGVEEVGKPRPVMKEVHGYEVLQGHGTVSGKLYGGCIESIYEAMVGESFSEEPAIIEKYHILPTEEEWKEMILFLETSDEKPTPEKLKTILMTFKEKNILSSVRGIIVGKPIDEMYYEEYKKVYQEVFADLSTPILYNVNFGHAVPRCILPYGAVSQVDYDQKTITIEEAIFD